MPDWGSLWGSSTASNQLTQYPDKNLLKAAALLKRDEQPTVPVRLFTDPEKLYQDELAPIGGKRLSDRAVGVTPSDGHAIYLKKNSMEYPNVWLLASKMAHEQRHVRGDGEIPAYTKELEVNSRYATRIDPNYRAALTNYLQGLRASK